VNVPGLGLFALDQHTANYTDNKLKLSPPFSRIQFHTFEDSDFNISKLLIRAGLNREMALGIEKFYETKALHAKESNTPFELEGLGKVISTTFLPENEALFNVFEGLEPISLSPLPSGVKNIIHDEAYLYELQKSQSYREEPSFLSQYLWPMTIGLVALIVILFWLFSPKTLQLKENLNQKTDIPKLDVIDSLLAEDTIITDNDFTKSDSSTLVASDLKKNLQNPTTEKPLDESKPIGKVQVDQCVIIVGAFKNATYAKRMEKSISKKGYQVYSSEHQGLKRVGVRFDCKETSPDDFKAKIRTQFNREAWSLSDTI
jgi:hypothetical protein